MAATNEMSEASIEAQVKNVIAEQLGVPPGGIAASARFIEDLGADSLDIVELVMAIEEKFAIEIPEEQSEHIKTVEDVVKYVMANCN
jgi:acyl carrier protein